MKKITILGSTGSIGQQAVEIIKKHSDEFQCYGLAAYSNLDLLNSQVVDLKPSIVAIVENNAAKRAKDLFSHYDLKVLEGKEGLYQLASDTGADFLLNSIVGAAGLKSTVAAVKSKIDLGLANKESLVIGGDIITKLLKTSKTNLIPVDSEHSAIFQCLKAGNRDEVNKLIITGSGGPFRGKKLKEMAEVKVEEALKHPRWEMGPKITIDSATLANKGLEYIEAHHLFGIDYDRIEIIIHPQSIIHSIVEFIDGSMIAHLGQTDMRIPIQYAFSFPKRIPGLLPSLELTEIEDLTFELPDYDNFPCLKLCMDAAKMGQTYPAVFNAANEEAVKFFLNQEIKFTDIHIIIREALENHEPVNLDYEIDVLLEVDKKTRAESEKLKNKILLK